MHTNTYTWKKKPMTASSDAEDSIFYTGDTCANPLSVWHQGLSAWVAIRWGNNRDPGLGCIVDFMCQAIMSCRLYDVWSLYYEKGCFGELATRLSIYLSLQTPRIIEKKNDHFQENYVLFWRAPFGEVLIYARGRGLDCGASAIMYPGLPIVSTKIHRKMEVVRFQSWLRGLKVTASNKVKWPRLICRSSLNQFLLI